MKGRETVARAIRQWFIDNVYCADPTEQTMFELRWIDCGEVDFREVADYVLAAQKPDDGATL